MCALLPGSSLPIWGVGMLFHGGKPGWLLNSAVLEYKPMVSHADQSCHSDQLQQQDSHIRDSMAHKTWNIHFFNGRSLPTPDFLFSKYGFLEWHHKCHLGTRILQPRAPHQGLGCQELRGQNSVIWMFKIFYLEIFNGKYHIHINKYCDYVICACIA